MRWCGEGGVKIGGANGAYQMHQQEVVHGYSDRVIQIVKISVIIK